MDSPGTRCERHGPVRVAQGIARRVLQLAAAILAALIPAVAGGAAEEVTLVKAGRLLDVRTGQVARDVLIRVEGTTIAAVGADLPIPADARVVDLSTAMVLPGLIDSHTHVCLAPEDAQKSPVLHKTHASRAVFGVKAAQDALNAGFTTLRDLDNEGADMADIAVRDAIRSGLFPGPRLFVAGWALSITAGHMNVTGLSPSVDRRVDQLAIMTDSPEAMVRAIREQAKAGVDIIKIYTTGTLRHIDRNTMEPIPQMSTQEVRLIVDEAARWRLDVAAHAYGGVGAKNAAEGGARSIEHGMFLDDAILRLMKAKGSWWVPTMSVYLPDEETPPADVAFREKIGAMHKDTFRRAMKAGVRIAFGTDIGSMPHGEGWRELARMADYGMRPIDAIRAATLEGAALLRREGDLGRIAPGYRADIIAVHGDPLADIAAFEKVVFVMADGKIVKSESANADAGQERP